MSESPSLRLSDIARLRPLWQRLRSLPPPVPEDSIALRVLVQGMVVIGIVATDVAAETQISLWAVPLSLVGATWSWYRRHHRNVLTKFILAIALLVSLVAFLSNLVTTLNDTRLILAELLIQVQVLHTFDLPRRKDLGYSMVIGLILLGVAGTISQTMAFGLFLILFLAFAVPALMFDYRSRLGLTRQHARRPPRQPLAGFRQSFPWKASIVLVAAVLSLGLILFAVMPRVPGYQLRSFPVSTTIDFRGQFDGRNIVTPEGSEGSEVGGNGGTGNAAEGPGELDDTYYYGFSDRINQNLRGTMTPKVVMRVRSQAPGFWRVTAFDEYTGQGWRISRNDDVRNVARSPWTFRFTLPFIEVRSNTREVIQTYSIVADLPGLIPALDQPQFIYFPTKEIAVGPEGSLRSPVFLTDGLTYTVISQVSGRDRTRLAQAPTDYPKRIESHYFQVPEDLRDRLREFTENVLADAPNPLTNPYEKSLYLAQYLKQNYRIPENPFGLPYLEEGEDLVTNFLFRCESAPDPQLCSPGGYPDHFSTVLTVLLRSIGIPARLATGFAPGEFNPFTGLYEVKNTDAFALTEVYFPQYGWFAFDPIPGRDVVPPSISEYEAFGVLRQFWDWVAGWLPSPVAGFIGGLFQFIGNAIEWVFQLFFKGWFGVLSGLLVLACFGFLGWLSWQGWREWTYRRRLAKLPAIERLYRQMLRTLAGRGLSKHPAQTPLEFASLARDRYPADLADTIDAIVEAYVRWRYRGEVADVQGLHQRWNADRTWHLKQRLKR
ncbi:transglutaminase [Leptolyngbya valderiana BDU 20041]|nr:transglutaminase [Leptolyngbya valderiana BDU 20041]PPT10222.1 hypothetical protein CKA32_005325 [Geitlerinema sp. FC II]